MKFVHAMALALLQSMSSCCNTPLAPKIKTDLELAIFCVKAVHVALSFPDH